MLTNIEMVAYGEGMRKTIQKKTTPFTVYLPAELDQQLRNLAHRENRTLSQQTTLVLREGLARLSRVKRVK